MPVSVTVRPWPSSEAAHSFLLSDDSDVARITSGPSSQRTSVGEMFLHNGRPYLQAVSDNYDIFINNCAESLPMLRGAVMLRNEDRLHISSQESSPYIETLLLNIDYQPSPLPQLSDGRSSNRFPTAPRYVLPKVATSQPLPSSPAHDPITSTITVSAAAVDLTPASDSGNFKAQTPLSTSVPTSVPVTASAVASIASSSDHPTMVPTSVVAADTIPSAVSTLPATSSTSSSSLRPLLQSAHIYVASTPSAASALSLSPTHPPSISDLVLSPPGSTPASPATFLYGDFVRASTPLRGCPSSSDASSMRAADKPVFGLTVSSDVCGDPVLSGLEASVVGNGAPSLAVTSVPTSVPAAATRSTSPSSSLARHDPATLSLSDTDDALSSHFPEQPPEYTSAVAAKSQHILSQLDTSPPVRPMIDASVPGGVAPAVSSALVALNRVQSAWTQARRWVQERLLKPSHGSSVHQATARVFAAWMDARRAVGVNVLSPLAARTTVSPSSIGATYTRANTLADSQFKSPQNGRASVEHGVLNFHNDAGQRPTAVLPSNTRLVSNPSHLALVQLALPLPRSVLASSSLSLTHVPFHHPHLHSYFPHQLCTALPLLACY